MAESSDSFLSQPRIAKELVDAAKKAFDPLSDAERRQSNLKIYNEIIAKYAGLL